MLANPETASEWTGVRLHIVTGKGGTGKTTLAAAAAIALAAQGRRTLLIEVEGRQGIAQLFDHPPLPYAERRVAVARGGGEVWALAVDVEGALVEYLENVYHLGRARWALRRVGALDFVTTIAPGLRDVFLTGKICQAVAMREADGTGRGGSAGRTGGARRTGGGRRALGAREADRPRYDAVVVDAPPTGRIARFLNVNEQVAALARVGPVRNQAESIMAVLRAPLTTVHVVTLLEEMPTQETVDVVAELAEIGLPVGGVMINMVRRSVLTTADLVQVERRHLPRGEIAAGLAAAGLPATPEMVDALVREAVDATDRVALEAAEREALASLGRPTYELPQLAEGIDLGGLFELAASLTEQGFAGGGS